MNRYIYYLIIINMLANIASVVPRVLLAKTKDGALISMGLGLVGGLILVYFFIRFFSKYPGKDLPHLMKTHTPKWLYLPLLFYFAIMWYLAGLTTLITYTYILVTFLTPEASFVVTVIPFLLILAYGVLMKTQKILYTVEIVLILFLPIGLFTFIKSYTSNRFEWDFVKVAIMHGKSYPDYSAFTATMFLSIGIINIIIFNRYFLLKLSIGLKELSIIGLIGFLVIFTTYFMPIGFEGFDNIDTLLYPWMSTTDSVRMKFGIIERLVFIFMLFFVSVSFMSMIIHWHVSAQILNSIIQLKKLHWKGKNLTLHLIAVLFSLIAFNLTNKLTATELFLYTKYFYNTLPIMLFFLFISMFSINRGAKL